MTPRDPERPETGPADRGQAARLERDAPLAPASRRAAALWSMGFSYAAQALVLARNIVLVPLFFEYIGKEEYNAWLVSGFVLTQLTSIDFGLMGVLLQRVAAAYGNRRRGPLERLIGTGVATVAVLAALLGLITAAISPFVPGFLTVTPAFAHRLTICFLIVALANAVQLVAFAVSGLLRALQRTFSPGLLVLISEAVALGLTVLLLIQGWGLYSIVAGLVARSVVGAVGCGATLWWVSRHHLRLHPAWDRSVADELWRLSSFQFLTQIAGRIKTTLDAFLIGVILGTEAGGGYSLTVRAHDTVRMFAFGVSGALGPALAHLHGEDAPVRFKEIALVLFKVQALIAAIGFGGVIAFNPAFMQLWVGPGVLSGNAVSVVAALAGIVYLLSTTPYDAIFASGGFAIITRIVWIEVVVRFLVMALLLRTIGVLGTPVASLSCQALAAFVPLAWIAVRRFHVTRGEGLASLAGVVKLTFVPLALAAIVLAALPPAPNWTVFIAEGGLYVMLCLCGTWWLDRDLVRFAVRGGRAVPG
jgi:O-antigen/teichoic acid export membrane protein